MAAVGPFGDDQAGRQHVVAVLAQMLKQRQDQQAALRARGTDNDIDIGIGVPGVPARGRGGPLATPQPGLHQFQRPGGIAELIKSLSPAQQAQLAQIIAQRRQAAAAATAGARGTGVMPSLQRGPVMFQYPAGVTPLGYPAPGVVPSPSPVAGGVPTSGYDPATGFEVPVPASGSASTASGSTPNVSPLGGAQGPAGPGITGGGGAGGGAGGTGAWSGSGTPQLPPNIAAGPSQSGNWLGPGGVNLTPAQIAALFQLMAQRRRAPGVLPRHNQPAGGGGGPLWP